jgi:hypothetical protein
MSSVVLRSRALLGMIALYFFTACTGTVVDGSEVGSADSTVTEQEGEVEPGCGGGDHPSGTCASFEGTGCYWMENTSGNYCWVPADWAPSIEDCFAMDSCDGGLGQSGGGCYKWADGSDGERAPW